MGKFDKTTGGPISKADANKKTKKWKENKDKKNIKTTGSFIGRERIESLLQKPDCTGIWVLYGQSYDGKSLEPIFAAGDSTGRIITSSTEAAAKSAGGDYYNYTTECPDDCPPE